MRHSMIMWSFNHSLVFDVQYKGTICGLSTPNDPSRSIFNLNFDNLGTCNFRVTQIPAIDTSRAHNILPTDVIFLGCS